MRQRAAPAEFRSPAINKVRSVVSQTVLAGSRPRQSGAKKTNCARDAEFFIDRDGRQHFNFAQQIWLDASVQMAYTATYTTALETLAVNLLTMAIPEQDYRAAIGFTSKRAVALAREFCEECLSSAPEQAWVLPYQTIKAWLLSHRQVRGR